MEKTSLSHALQRYLSEITPHKKGAPQESCRIRQLLKTGLAKIPIADLRSSDIAAYRDARLASKHPTTKRPISSGTVRLELALISHVLDVAMKEWHLCDSNAVLQVRKPKPAPARRRIATTREIRKITNYCQAHGKLEMLAITKLALETAMRQGELLSLRWENINLKLGVAHLPDTKNGDARDVPLSPAAKRILQEVGPALCGQVFRCTANSLKSAWRSMKHALGFPDLRFHDLRHTATTNFFSSGKLNIMEVAAITGHKTLSMLKRYTHLEAIRIARKIGRQGRALSPWDYLSAYPADISSDKGMFRLTFPDFDNLNVRETTMTALLESARNALLRHLLTITQNGTPPPPPSESTPRLQMVSPL